MSSRFSRNSEVFASECLDTTILHLESHLNMGVDAVGVAVVHINLCHLVSVYW